MTKFIHIKWRYKKEGNSRVKKYTARIVCPRCKFSRKIGSGITWEKIKGNKQHG